MPNYICIACGVQYAESEAPPTSCTICEDERQFVGFDGQQWTTLDEMQVNYSNHIEEVEPGLTHIGTDPAFGIGQHAFLVQAPGGNVLWDCFTLIDDATVEAVEALGGISAVAISHPHFYSTMVEWSRAFGDVPVYLHAADRQWIMRPDPCIVHWEGEAHSLGAGLTLIHGGGHFDGSSMLHWASGAKGRGVLLTGDTITVAYDRRRVTWMYSFPNYIPLSEPGVRGTVDAVAPFAFDRIYAAWPGRVIKEDAQAVVELSAERYIRALKA